MENSTIATIDVDLTKIKYDEDKNPRDIGIEKEAENDKAKMSIESLSESIRANGLLSPIILEKYSDQQESEFEYSIVAGHRRYRAYKLISQSDDEYLKIPAIIREIKNEEDRRYLTLTENASRQGMTEEELAKEVYALYIELQQKGNGKKTGYGTIAKRIGISRSYAQKLVNKEKNNLKGKDAKSHIIKNIEEVEFEKAKEILVNVATDINLLNVNISKCDIDTQIKVKNDAQRLCTEMQKVISFIRKVEKNITKDKKIEVKEKVRKIENIMGAGRTDYINLDGDIF